MKLNKNVWQSVIAAAGIMIAATTPAAAQGSLNKIVEPGQKVFGLSYNELVEEWTNWFAAEPLATHPALDPDGQFCDRNQEGDVWFLASTFGGVVNRTCEIPAGKAIFISIGGAGVSFGPEFPAAGDPCLQMATDVERVRCDVNNDVPVAPDIALEATLDGVPVQDLFAFRAQSRPGGFTLRVPNPSFVTDLGLPAGDRYPAVADGYFLLIKPLKPGVHTLTVRRINADQSDAGVNYTLIIEDDEDN